MRAEEEEEEEEVLVVEAFSGSRGGEENVESLSLNTLDELV